MALALAHPSFDIAGSGPVPLFVKVPSPIIHTPPGYHCPNVSAFIGGGSPPWSLWVANSTAAPTEDSFLALSTASWDREITLVEVPTFPSRTMLSFVVEDSNGAKASAEELVWSVREPCFNIADEKAEDRFEIMMMLVLFSPFIFLVLRLLYIIAVWILKTILTIMLLFGQGILSIFVAIVELVVSAWESIATFPARMRLPDEEAGYHYRRPTTYIPAERSLLLPGSRRTPSPPRSSPLGEPPLAALPRNLSPAPYTPSPSSSSLPPPGYAEGALVPAYEVFLDELEEV